MNNSKFSKEDVDDFINEMFKHSESPSKAVVNILTYEKDHKEWMINNFYDCIKYFEHSFDLLINLINEINCFNKDEWTNHRTIQLIVLKNSLYPLFSAFNRMTSGFYSDAMILLRTTYESFVRLLYLSYFPDNLFIPFFRKEEYPEIKIKLPVFNVTKFIKDDLKVNWKFIYSMSSSFAHSYRHLTMEETKDIFENGQEESIVFKMKSDFKMASVPVNFSLFLLWCLIKFSVLLFVDPKDENLKPEFYTKLITTEKALGAIISTMPNKWATTYEDVERIQNEIKQKEDEFRKK